MLAQVTHVQLIGYLLALMGFVAYNVSKAKLDRQRAQPRRGS